MKNSKFLNLIFTVALSSTFVSGAHATVITFEELSSGLTAMTNAVGAAVPASSQLTNQYLSSNGVAFTSLAGYAALVNHGSGNPSASIPNIIGGTTFGGNLNYNSPITISFFDVANTSIKAVTNAFLIQGDWFPLGSGQVFATAYSAEGIELGSTSDTDNKIFGVSGPKLQFSFDGIHSVVISGDNGTVGFDQLEYGDLTPVNVATVPVPAALVLMLSGLGFFGFTARRRS